ISITQAGKDNQLYALKIKTYQSNKTKLPISEEYINQVIDFVVQHQCGELLEARDENDQVHAVALFVRDKNTTYYLFGASDPEYKNSGAMSLLMWDAIKRSSKITNQFNFEGSMIEDIERFFRGFGARQV